MREGVSGFWGWWLGGGGRGVRSGGLREFVLNSRHPDPRRVWKVGSGARLLPPLQGNPGNNSEASIFDNPSGDLEQKIRKARPQKPPRSHLGPGRDHDHDPDL